MGYLPEALVNYLALLGWGAEDGKTETFTLDELAQAFTLERVTPSPAVFDFDKLNWLNRHYVKLAAPERIADLAEEQFRRQRPDIFPLWPPREGNASAATLSAINPDQPIHLGLPPDQLDAQRRSWFVRLISLFSPAVDHLDQLPAKTAFIFGFDPDAARANPENAAVLAADSTRSVLGEFGGQVRSHSGPVRPEDFKAWMAEIKEATGIKGKDLFHPVRIALTGAHSGPDFDKILPLIEDGSMLGLPVPSVCERVEQFVGV